jgi:ferrous iron transport protein B
MKLPQTFSWKELLMSIERTNLATVPIAHPSAEDSRPDKLLTIVLAGNANVGKSAIFNQLTGLVQETGNWAGKTVGVREGLLAHHGRRIKIVDLPGIYSFATYSPEEILSREYILTQHPDIVINVLDATSLERNLYFTLQLKEMNVPLVIALNYADIARKKHIQIDVELLGRLLQAPVINTIAIKGIGVHELIDSALGSVEKSPAQIARGQLRYGTEVESRIGQLNQALKAFQFAYPSRWTAIQLLEGDNNLVAEFSAKSPELISLARTLSAEIAGIHGEDSATIMAGERYALAARIAKQAGQNEESGTKRAGFLDNVTLHSLAGYSVFVALMAGILIVISLFGGWVTDSLTALFNSINPHWPGALGTLFWDGAIVGFYASLSVALGFILPFFLILSWLGESGYLPRIAFLMDRPCHAVGLHGQASLPLITALGCNVPACLGCRIMENKRDRLIAIFLSSLVPCSARTSVVLGLVGAFIGWQWAVALLVFQFAIIFLVGHILNRLAPSNAPGIIMEIPEYRWPDLRVVWGQAWFRFKDFLTIGLPFIIAGSIVIEFLRTFNILNVITQALTPVTVSWLGLPAFTGVLLIFGILRKEAILALLISFAGGAEISSLISPLQMVVFSIVIMLYVPCISTVAVMLRETSLKITAWMVVSEIALALLAGGLAYRVLSLFIR